MAILSPFPKFRAFDANGNPLAGAKLFTYEPGTLTPKATVNAASGTPNTNPVICNAQGEADVWLNGVYRWILTDSNDVQQWDIDQIGATVGSAFLSVDATERQLTAPINTPQILQSDSLPANTMSLTRMLQFEYFGECETRALNPLILRLKYDSTELWSFQNDTQQVGTYVWKLTGTLLMRSTLNAQLLIDWTINPDPSTKNAPTISFERKVAVVDLSAAFALVLEAERNNTANTLATLYGSTVQVSS